MPGHWALLTNISNMCTKAEVTGNRDLSSPATHQLIFSRETTFAAVRAVFIKTLFGRVQLNLEKQKAFFFPRYSLPIVIELLKSFPVNDLFPNVLLCSHLKKKNMWWSEGRRRSPTSLLGLQIHIQGNVWKCFLKGLLRSQSLQKQLFFQPGGWGEGRR